MVLQWLVPRYYIKNVAKRVDTYDGHYLLVKGRIQRETLTTFFKHSQLFSTSALRNSAYHLTDSGTPIIQFLDPPQENIHGPKKMHEIWFLSMIRIDIIAGPG